MAVDFDAWFRALPRWLQAAGVDLLADASPPDQPRVARLADLCVDEVRGVAITGGALPSGIFDAAAGGPRVRVRRVDDLAGVNALHSSAALDFGDADLTVVYGHNGSGKSGYSRLMKHAAGARTARDLLPNVFDVGAPAPRGRFVVERDGVANEERWAAASGPLAALAGVHVFDAEVARQYVSGKTEASYEPRRLRFLSQLAGTCTAVEAELKSRREALKSKLPAVPAELTSTTTATFLQQLGGGADPNAVAARVVRAEDHAERAKVLRDALSAADPAQRRREVEGARGRASDALTFLTRVCADFSDERAAALHALRVEASDARRAVDEAAAVLFEKALVQGVGTATWRALWEAARAYAGQVAFPGCSFPHVAPGARCPLCQQELAPEAAQRLVEFEAFVRNDLEAKALAAEAALRAARQGIAPLASLDDWLPRFAGVIGAEGACTSAHASVAARRAAMVAGSDVAQAPALDVVELETLIRGTITALEAERDVLDQALTGTDRPKLEAELRELAMRDWCSDNLTAVLEEVERRREVAEIDAAIKKTGTAVITKKKSELAADELTAAYKGRFERECAALGASSLRVRPEPASKAKATVEFAIEIVDAKRAAKAEQVLSEGESRVAALAAFLADVTVSGARAPFIFDDPISSLDYDYEERVATRLVELAADRQVIIFTHRLSLAALVTDAHKKLTKPTKPAPSNEPKLKQLYLTRVAGRAGYVAESSIATSNLTSALNHLLNDRGSAATKALAATDISVYDAIVRAICGDLRILTESAIEQILLNGVVERFKRPITTKNKLVKLASITPRDCEYLDELMTRYSCFEHSQPQELPGSPPELDDLLRDVTGLREWATEFGRRKTAGGT